MYGAATQFDPYGTLVAATLGTACRFPHLPYPVTCRRRLCHIPPKTSHFLHTSHCHRSHSAPQDITSGEELFRVPLRLALTAYADDPENSQLYEGAPW